MKTNAAIVEALLSVESQLRKATDRVDDQIQFYLDCCMKQNEEICQTLGQALGYPWYKNDQKNFPGSTDMHGVCVGEHVAESIASEAANRIRNVTRQRDELLVALKMWARSQERRVGPLCWCSEGDMLTRMQPEDHATACVRARKAVADAESLYGASELPKEHATSQSRIVEGYISPILVNKLKL